MRRVVPTEIVAYVDQHFGFAAKDQAFNVDLQFKDRVSALLRLMDELPDELVAIAGANYTRIVHNIETMRSTIELWNGIGATGDVYNRRLGAAITDLRKCLVLLPDQVIPPETEDLSFIGDADLRTSIRMDIAAARQAFQDNEWKGSTVLGGAVVEALLMWKLTENGDTDARASFARLQAQGTISKKLSDEPDEWSLETFKKVAADLKLVDARSIKMIDLAQSFRNLIHPGKARRTAEKCSLSTAHTALAAMERLIEQWS